MKIFRFGKFYEYDESFADNSWSYEQILKAAAFFATSRYYNYDESLCYSLSSMYVYMDEPEMKYEKIYMDMLETIKDLVEKA
jgi:hypothetical protein